MGSRRQVSAARMRGRGGAQGACGARCLPARPCPAPPPPRGAPRRSRAGAGGKGAGRACVGPAQCRGGGCWLPPASLSPSLRRCLNSGHGPDLVLARLSGALREAGVTRVPESRGSCRREPAASGGLSVMRCLELLVVPAGRGRRAVFPANLQPSAVYRAYTQLTYMENMSPEGKHFFPGIYSVNKQRLAGQEGHRTG